MTSAPTTWVVGAGGLLGRAVCRTVERAGGRVQRVAVPWADERRSIEVLADGAARLVGTSGPQGWRVAWCAGAGIVGTGPEELAAEQRVFTGFLEALAAAADQEPDLGAVFLASSAGGVYAGSSDPPFSEDTVPVPISAYGHAKLEMERLAAAAAEECGVPLLIGRISNLYGPGQDFSKPQGLVSQVCRARLLGQSLNVYVPLDTVRDYVYVDDCARMVVAGLDGVAERVAGRNAPVLVKVMASQRPTTIGTVLAEFRRVFKRRPLVVLGESATSKLQVGDLRMRSVVWPELDAMATTTLAVGIRSTLEDVSAQIRAGAQQPA